MYRRGLLVTLIALVSLCAVPSSASAQWPDLATELPSLGGGERDAMVIVGIEDYVFVPDIGGAASNAQAWYAFATRSMQVPVDRVTLLRNHEGTREKVLRHVRAAAGKVQAGGRLWVVFIGHGAPGKSGTEGVLVGADAQAEADSLYARSIGQTELLDAARTGNKGSVVAVLDACFSGRVADGAPLVKGLQPLVPVADQGRLPANTTLLSAGGVDQFAGPLPGLDRPAFSYLLLGALRGWGDGDGDRRVTAREAVDYTVTALTSVVRTRTQTPTVAGATDRVLAEGSTEAGPDLGAIVNRPQMKAVARPSEHADGGQLWINAGDDGFFNGQVIGSDGEAYHCRTPITDAEPCAIRGLPHGKALVRLTGDAHVSREIEIGVVPTVVDIDPPYHWMGPATLASLGLTTAGILMLTLGGDEDELLAGTQIFGILMIELGAVAAMTFGIWYYYTDYTLEDAEPGSRKSSERAMPFSWAVPSLEPGPTGLSASFSF